MRRFWVFAVYGVLAVIFESTLLSGFPASALRFDFILMGVIGLALAEERRLAIPCVIMMGSFLDVSTCAPFGLGVFSYLTVYGFFRAVISNISIEMWVARFVWVGSASFLGKLATIFLIYVSSGSGSAVYALAKYAPAQALFDAAVGLFMIPLVMRLDSLEWDRIFKPKGLVLR